MNLSVIIPAFNEEKAIALTLEQTSAEIKKIIKGLPVKKAEVIVVDDGSKDSTAQIVEKFASKGVVLVRHKKNQGYGSALKSGFARAKGELIAFYDADGTYPINHLGKMCKRLIEEKADMVIGSRLGKGTKMSRERYIGNKFFVFFLNFLGNSSVKDTASGMRIFRKELAQKFFSLPNGLNFTPAMTAEAVHQGWKTIYEPIPYAPRIGQSKLGTFRDGMNFFLSIVNVAKLYNPLKLFGLVGLLFLLFSLLLLYPVFFFFTPFWELGMRRIFFIIIFFLIGLNLIFFGFLANFMVKLFYEQLPSDIIYRWAYDRYLLTKYNLAGIILFFLGIGVIFFTQTGFHWAIPLIGLVIASFGIQLVSSATIIKILKELYEKRIIKKR